MSQPILLAIEAISEVDRMASIASRYGHELVILSEDPSHYGEYQSATILPFPTRDTHALRNYIAEHRSSLAQVFSVTDTWGVIASQLRDEFDFPRWSSTEVIEQLRDKSFVQERLIIQGLASPPNTWPRILKPRGGTGKIGVRLVHSEEELRQLQGSSSDIRDDYIQQAVYRGPMYSAEVWKDRSRYEFFGITNRIMDNPPSFLEKVKSFPWAAETEWEKRVKSWAGRILDALDYHLGLAHLEFIETDSGFELVELNSRMAGALITPGILATTNYDPYALCIEQALGVEVNLPSERRISQGFSHLSVYAEQCGILSSIKGVDKIQNYPGELAWHPTKELGTEINELRTYRSRIGHLSACGPSAEIAQDRVIAAAREIYCEVH